MMNKSQATVYFVLVIGCSRKEITEHWEWLEQNLLQTLSIFENENDINTFVRGKIQVAPVLPPQLIICVTLICSYTLPASLFILLLGKHRFQWKCSLSSLRKKHLIVKGLYQCNQ